MSTHHSEHSTSSLHWAKSSHSDSHGGNCVEVASASGTVHIRDSKRPHHARLTFATAQWAAFLSGLRDDAPA